MAVCFFKIFAVVLGLLLKHGLLGGAQELIPNLPQQLNIAPPAPNLFIGFRSEVWGDDVVPGWKIDGRDLNMNTENECFISQPGSADGVVVATLCTNRCPSTVTVKAQSGVRIDSQTANVTRQAPPTDLWIVNTTNSTILISWTPPLIPTGIHYYHVVYITDIDTGNPVEVPDTTTDYDSYMYSLPSTCDECLQHWTSSNPLILFASAPNNTFLFKKSSGIDPRHTFRFQVTTGSLAGESERSEAVEGRFQNGTSGNPGTTPNEDSNLTAILAATCTCILCACILIPTGSIIGVLCCYRRRATRRSQPDANGSRGNSTEDHPDSKYGQPQLKSCHQLPHPDIPNEEASSEETSRTTGRCAVVIGQTVPRHRPTKTALERDTRIPIEDGEESLESPLRRFPDPETCPTQGFDSTSEKMLQIPEPGHHEATMDGLETASYEGATEDVQLPRPYSTSGETAAVVFIRGIIPVRSD